jgi:hypothetical protein
MPRFSSRSSGGRFLSAGDLVNGSGQKVEVPVVIDRYELDVEMQQGGDTKDVVFFKGKNKGLALNNVNGNTIEQAYGDMDQWEGKDIILYPAETMFGNKMVPCIRLRVPLATATTEDEPPF